MSLSAHATLAHSGPPLASGLTPPTPAARQNESASPGTPNDPLPGRGSDTFVPRSPTLGNDGEAAPPSNDASQNDKAPGQSSQASAADTPQQTKPNGEPLTEEERKQVDELKQRDAEVRRHEQAHKAAAGPHARGGPTYEFQTGPDGKRYAVGGSVQIDTSEVPGDPRATIQKMQTIRRAALAPAEPSSQDRAVAAQASRTAQKARQELQKQNSEQVTGPGDPDESENTASDPTRPLEGQPPVTPAAGHDHDHESENLVPKTPQQASRIGESRSAELVGQLVDTFA